MTFTSVRDGSMQECGCVANGARARCHGGRVRCHASSIFTTPARPWHRRGVASRDFVHTHSVLGSCYVTLLQVNDRSLVLGVYLFRWARVHPASSSKQQRLYMAERYMPCGLNFLVCWIPDLFWLDPQHLWCWVLGAKHISNPGFAPFQKRRTVFRNKLRFTCPVGGLLHASLDIKILGRTPRHLCMVWSEPLRKLP